MRCGSAGTVHIRSSMSCTAAQFSAVQCNVIWGRVQKLKQGRQPLGCGLCSAPYFQVL